MCGAAYALVLRAIYFSSRALQGISRITRLQKPFGVLINSEPRKHIFPVPALLLQTLQLRKKGKGAEKRGIPRSADKWKKNKGKEAVREDVVVIMGARGRLF